MDIKETTDLIFKKLEENPSLIYSESDLKCQLYSELIKDNTLTILTEWAVKKGIRTDMVVYNKEELTITKKKIDITKYKVIIELKAFYYESQKGKREIINENIGYLLDLKEFTESLFLICFDLTKNPIPEEELNKLRKEGVILIYKHFDNQPK